MGEYYSGHLNKMGHCFKIPRVVDNGLIRHGRFDLHCTIL